MKKEIELEFKSLISEKKYKQLEKYFEKIADKQKLYSQKNYYFDSKDEVLNKLGITLRLREKNDKWEKTLKLPSLNKNNKYKESIEINEEISEEKAKMFIEDGFDLEDETLKNILKPLGNLNLKMECLGSLKTERLDFKFYSDTISLDKSMYNDVIDYEIEWETSNIKFAEKTMEKLKLKLNNGNGKRKRFLKTKPITK